MVLIMMLLLKSAFAYAQNEPMYSQYIFNTLVINPAYAGSQGDLNATAVYRKQWMDIEGAPSSQTFSIHSPIKKRKIALGLLAVHDKIGVTGKTGLYGIYAYRISFNNNSKLSLGLQAGLVQMVSRFSKIQTKQANDPDMSADKSIYVAPGVGAGVYWYSPRYYLGVSVPDLLEVRINEHGETVKYRHLFVHGGYVFKLSYQVKYLPGFLVKDVMGSKAQIDINNIFILNDVLWLGLGYRIGTSLNFIVQAQITNQLQAGYSYDAPFSRFSSVAGASHEFKLSYRFVFFKDNAYMPRYF
ncbi:membrane protein [Sporocytophaga myxococcoides]|uniref:Membrane protein n=1 Tax=Sporocytophaga myxococcoides TaxID=153721 RepID=A0A098LKL0_9BACT|nr:type IX secretion system membrane protein PorP/SprF [Sporocytophaga myxococcoides]GAL86862.1 membrane protein [Sporocytophaga myxococcoides]